MAPIRSLLFLCSALLAGCSGGSSQPEQNIVADDEEVLARVAYADCLSSKSEDLHASNLPIQAVADVAVARCLKERDQFTLEIIRATKHEGGLDQASLKVPLDLRDSFERKYLKAIREKAAAARGIEWNETSGPNYM